MFLPWLQAEFGMAQGTAYNFIHVTERFGDKFTKFVNLATSALYLLASPGTPQSAIDEAVRLADDGKKVTHAMAQKLIAAEKAREEAEQVIFDYRLLSAEKREFVLQKTDETQWLLKKTAENIIKIGKNLLEVKDILPHGQFLSWIISEFGMSDQSARNYIHVAERFGGKIKNFLNLSSSVLYSLAAPTTPQSAVDQALELAESGKKVTHAMAQKLIAAEKAKEEADKKAAEAHAEMTIAQQKLFGAQSEAHTRITELTQQIDLQTNIPNWNICNLLHCIWQRRALVQCARNPRTFQR